MNMISYVKPARDQALMSVISHRSAEMNSSLSLILMVTFALSLSSWVSLPLANAWTGLGATWPSLPVPYEVNAVSSQELGSEASIAVIQASYASWSDPACSGYRVQYRGTTSQSWTSGDGVNTHQWIYSNNQRPQELGGRETIGVTLSLYRGSTLVDGDIIYNGIDHDWTTRMTRAGQVDAQSIITHEIGHQLGLGHTNVNGATMYPSYGGGEGPRTLSQDDLEGVCSLYPSGGGPQCAESGDCPSMQECVQGQCVNVSSGEGQIGDDCSVAPCDQSLVCVQSQDNSSFCTRVCNDGTCPGGWGCYAVNSSQGQVNLCLPQQGGNGDLNFGEACESGPECASGLCVSDGQQTFCSQSCAGEEDCPNQSTCQGLSNGGGACIPTEGSDNETPFGTPCMQPSDCENGLCLDDDIELYCTLVCNTDRDCPEYAACLSAGDINICAKTRQDGEMSGGSIPPRSVEMRPREMRPREMRPLEMRPRRVLLMEIPAIPPQTVSMSSASLIISVNSAQATVMTQPIALRVMTASV